MAPHQNISKIFETQSILLPRSTKSKSDASAIVETQQNESINNSESMEVSVDPGMYLDEESIVIEDDEETVSAAEAKIETAKILLLKKEIDKVQEPRELETSVIQSRKSSLEFVDDKQIDLSPNSELQNVVTSSSTKVSKSAIEKPLKKKKQKEEKLRSRRKKIVIRINPSPLKRNARERLPPKFSCAICKKTLSSKRNVQLHQETHKEANGKFRCDGEGCKKLFGKLENFLKHQEIHVKPARRRKNQNEK